MAATTKAQLATRVLRRIGVLGQNQTASAADSALVEAIIDDLHASLRRDGLAPFYLTAIPDGAQVPLEMMVAGRAITPFGVTGERRQVIMADALAGRRDLSIWARAARPARDVRITGF